MKTFKITVNINFIILNNCYSFAACSYWPQRLKSIALQHLRRMSRLAIAVGRKAWLPNNFCKSTPVYSWFFFAVENLTMSQSEDASEPQMQCRLQQISVGTVKPIRIDLIQYSFQASKNASFFSYYRIKLHDWLYQMCTTHFVMNSSVVLLMHTRAEDKIMI